VDGDAVDEAHAADEEDADGAGVAAGAAAALVVEELLDVAATGAGSAALSAPHPASRVATASSEDAVRRREQRGAVTRSTVPPHPR